MLKCLLISFFVAVVAFVAAAVLGWREYLANPAGMLLYTPIGPCPTLAHSFGVGLSVGLVAAALIAGLVALASFLAGFVSRWKTARRLLQTTWQTALLVIFLLYVLSFTQPIFEAWLPQQKVLGCA
jgi:predicted alpha/beta hydrolase